MIATGPGWELRLGDCIAGMRELADDSVDVTITDPPYEEKAHLKIVRSRAKDGATDRTQIPTRMNLPFAQISEDQRRESSWHLARVTQRWALVFCQVEAAHLWADAMTSAPFGLEYVRTCIWVKPGASPQFTGDRPGMGYESIVVCHKRGRKRWNGGGRVGVFEFPPVRSAADAQHPTTKPLALMRELVSLFSDPNELVLDPFSGSGSTGVACRQLGRRFLGFELNRDYFDIACRRLRGDEAKPNQAQPSLFGERIP